MQTHLKHLTTGMHLLPLVLSLVLFAGFVHTPVQNSSPTPSTRRGAQKITFGDIVTLTGRLEQIKTYGHDAKAVFPHYLYTKGKIMVVPDQGYAPADADRVLDGMEVKMVGRSDAILEGFAGKEVTIKGRVSGGLDLYCFDFGLYVDSSDDVTLHQQ